MTAHRFYDDLSAYYDLVYADWEGSMARQGDAIHRILQKELGGRPPQALRILDAAAGIGTQTLPLAQMGYRMVGRDLSPRAIARLGEEAEKRGLRVDSAPSDMCEVERTVEGTFDAVIALDNALAHLLDDDRIRIAFRGFRRLLGVGGRMLISVRDYEAVDRNPTSVHPYGEQERGGRRFRLEQHWEWTSADHYSTTFLVLERQEGEWVPIVRTRTAFYALPIPRFLRLMEEAGFEASRVEDTSFFQPVLLGRVVE